MRNILTFDIEDYFQVENLKGAVDFSDWDKFECRVENNTRKILQILESFRVKATFFVLGWVAEKYPQLIKDIHSAGHEIASHGYSHQLISSQTPEEFRSDIRRAKKILEDITQDKINGYRAPCYSITKKTLWALRILTEEGFSYDSSIFPICHDRGGIRQAERFTHKINLAKGFLWEYPISTIKLCGQNLPFSGGGYFRLLPYALVRQTIKKLNRQDRAVNIYLHPWEFDPQQPRIKNGFLNTFRHYVNISKTETKLRQLLKDFEFSTIRDSSKQ